MISSTASFSLVLSSGNLSLDDGEPGGVATALPTLARSDSDMDRFLEACNAEPAFASLATRRKYFCACVRTCVAFLLPTNDAMARTSFAPNLCRASRKRLCSDGVQYRLCGLGVSALDRSFSASDRRARSRSISERAASNCASNLEILTSGSS